MIGGAGSRDGYGKRIERLTKRAARSFLASLSQRKRRGPVPAINTASVKKLILIRQHNQFGDVLCTVPLLRSLHTKYKPEELAVVVSPQNKDALEGCPYITRLIEYDKLTFYRKPSLFLKFAKELRRGYDVLIVPSNVSLSLTNDIMAFFVKAKMKFGPASLESKSNRTSSVYDFAVDLSWGERPVHQSFRNMKVASPLGVGKEADNGELEYRVDPNSEKDARLFISRLSKDGIRKVALHAGAGKTPNRWNVVNFATLANLLHDQLNVEVFLTEGPMDREVIENLANLIKSPFVRVRNRAIAFVAALLKQMDLVITNDTGIMHLGAAVGTPTLSLFGPTDPLQWAPLGKRNRFIMGKDGDINTIGVDKTFAMARKVLQSGL